MKPKKAIKPVKAWAIWNWNNTAIVNDGTGQKRIYRTKQIADRICKALGYGTSVKPISITPLK